MQRIPFDRNAWDPQDWPKDPPGYVFLGRAVLEVGRRMFPATWDDNLPSNLDMVRLPFYRESLYEGTYPRERPPAGEGVWLRHAEIAKLVLEMEYGIELLPDRIEYLPAAPPASPANTLGGLLPYAPSNLRGMSLAELGSPPPLGEPVAFPRFTQSQWDFARGFLNERADIAEAQAEPALKAMSFIYSAARESRLHTFVWPLRDDVQMYSVRPLWWAWVDELAPFARCRVEPHVALNWKAATAEGKTGWLYVSADDLARLEIPGIPSEAASATPTRKTKSIAPAVSAGAANAVGPGRKPRDTRATERAKAWIKSRPMSAGNKPLVPELIDGQRVRVRPAELVPAYGAYLDTLQEFRDKGIPVPGSDTLATTLSRALREIGYVTSTKK